MAYIGSKRLLNITSRGDSCYIRFSEYADGTNFTSARKDGQGYVGFATGQNPPTNKTEYTWVKLIGGSCYIRYSAYEDGRNFTSERKDGQDYIGFATGQEPPTDKTKYTWIKLTGGTGGSTGGGTGGGTGDSCFIRYSAYEDGTDFTEDWSEGQNYIGIATAQSAPTNKTAYIWSKFKDDSIDEALDRILEIQQSLIGYTVGIYRRLPFSMTTRYFVDCYVSKTKPMNAEDYDAIIDVSGDSLVSIVLEGVRKLYVWSENSYTVSACKTDSENQTFHGIIADHSNGSTFDKALEIEITEDSYFSIFSSENGCDAFPGIDSAYDEW